MIRLQHYKVVPISGRHMIAHSERIQKDRYYSNLLVMGYTRHYVRRLICADRLWSQIGRASGVESQYKCDLELKNRARKFLGGR
ncbi:hypothetical protein [Bacillus cereus]|uniref:Phage protein n=1 Tax=Bacillus cereus TIAC219 TaxID=718222 RepID=A0ABC9SQL1_BACCE|nr:hypothetical protein [Bacillus cereus]EJP81087.1 hypothetical protein IC1_06668 [Bacillus cereus VD022]EOQ57882.1 hypothetical protein IAY_06204 [Bacillus cereus TIAC219]